MKQKRYAVLDNLRGAILISMILYHGCWDLVYLFGNDWNWYRSELTYVWQQSICWGFILLSGFCWSFSSSWRNQAKRGLTVFAAGVLISFVTILVMPDSAIRFGVLTLLGSAMILTIPLNRYLCRWQPTAGLLLCSILFLLTRRIHFGVFGFRSWEFGAVPEFLYANLFTAYLGFPPDDFFSTDYFALTPWLFLFLCGYFIHRIFLQKSLMGRLAGGVPGQGRVESPVKQKQTQSENAKPRTDQNRYAGPKADDGGCAFFRKLPLLTWLGRHSLIVYLLHQPVTYGILYIYYSMTTAG